MVDRQAEPDPVEVGLSERHLVGSLDPFAGIESPLLHESPVDPDQVPQRLVLGVVGAHDRGSVGAIPGDHHDLVRRSGIGMCHDRECKEKADSEQQQPFQDSIPLPMIFFQPTFLDVRWHPPVRMKIRFGPFFSAYSSEQVLHTRTACGQTRTAALP